MTAKRKGLWSAIVGMSARASTQVFMIAVTLVATRYLVPADFGIFALASAFITLARTLLYAGPFEYLMKAPDLQKSASECLLANLVLASASAIVLVGIALASPHIFTSGGIEGLMLALAPTVLIAAVASWEESQILRSGQVKTYYLITMIVELSSSLLAVVLLVLHFGLFALVLQNYARSVLLAILYRLMITLPTLRRPDWTHLRTIVTWSLSRYGSVILSFLSNYSGDLILGAVLSPTSTGLYRASSRVVSAAADVFSQPGAIIAMSNLSRRFAAGKPADGHWLPMGSGLAFIGYPALLGMAMIADRMAPVVLGANWAAAGPVIAILCVGRMAGLLTIFAGTSLFVYDRQRLVFVLEIVAAAAAAVLTLLLAPAAGTEGAAIASALSGWLSGLCLVYYAVKMGGVTRSEWRNAGIIIVLPMLATAAGTILGTHLGPHLAATAAGQLAVSVAGGALGWGVSALLLRERVMNALHLLGQEQTELLA